MLEGDQEDKKSLTLLLCYLYWEFWILDQFTVSRNAWILLGKRILPNSNQLSGNQESLIIRLLQGKYLLRSLLQYFLGLAKEVDGGNKTSDVKSKALERQAEQLNNSLH
ncbi:hypothetical protein MKW98_005382 [Papaver atlanticum]|uniref:Uncharacterized protein n=1 Tax=Papaver atlanticum TaxID=357466 RepID=A0AAD4X3Z0_9MAGN|nr:hypothetical protein MKW98_005382 [Papaver atlanticum]